MSRVFLLILAISLSGCAGGLRYEDHASGAAPIPPAAAAATIFRTSGGAVMTGIRSVLVKVGGEKVGSLPPGSYRQIQLTPGKHVLAATLQGDIGKCEVEMVADGGKEYFFEIEPRAGALLSALNPSSYFTNSALGQCSGSITIRRLSAEEALPRVNSTRAVD